VLSTRQVPETSLSRSAARRGSDVGVTEAHWWNRPHETQAPVAAETEPMASASTARAPGGAICSLTTTWITWQGLYATGVAGRPRWCCMKRNVPAPVATAGGCPKASARISPCRVSLRPNSSCANTEQPATITASVLRPTSSLLPRSRSGVRWLPLASRASARSRRRITRCICRRRRARPNVSVSHSFPLVTRAWSQQKARRRVMFGEIVGVLRGRAGVEAATTRHLPERPQRRLGTFRGARKADSAPSGAAPATPTRRVPGRPQRRLGGQAGWSFVRCSNQS
jgi:hypothetical protein